MQNLVLVNPKCVTYATPVCVPLSGMVISNYQELRSHISYQIIILKSHIQLLTILLQKHYLHCFYNCEKKTSPNVNI